MMLRSLGDGRTEPMTAAEEAQARADVAAGKALLRLVSGVEVLLSPEEEAAVRAEWEKNRLARAELGEAESRLAAFDQAIDGDTTLTQFRAMTITEFNAWWDANVTTSAAAIAVLKRLVWLVIRRVL